jgi:hypothetical protein
MVQKLIPAWVPPDISARLPKGELALDGEALRVELDSLGKALEHHIAAYNNKATRVPAGLCSIFEAAPLTAEQVAVLRDAERRHPYVVFVAYRRPLTYR